MTMWKVAPLLFFASDYRNTPLLTFLERHPWPFLLYPGDLDRPAPAIAYPRAIESSPPKRNRGSTMRFSPEDEEATLPPSMREVVVERALLIPLPFREQEDGSALVHIGRSKEMDLYIEDKEISQFHATIFAEGESFFLRDEGSTNETYLNGVALSPHERHLLRDEDAVEFGLGKLFLFLLPKTVFQILKAL